MNASGRHCSSISRWVATLLAAVIASGVWTLSALAQEPKPPRVAGEKPAAEGPRLGVEWDPTYTFSLGAGGALGLDWGRYSFGFAGFATSLNPFFRDLFLDDAGDVEVPLNWGAELYSDYYFQPTREGFGVGALVSFDQFKIEADADRETLEALYLVPRVLYRFYLVEDFFYFEPALAAAIKLWDSGAREVGESIVSAGPVAPIGFLTLGLSFEL